MSSTFFQDYNQNTPVVSVWLNDVNAGIYTPQGIPKKAIQSSAAWVRFSATGGVVTVGQSTNVATVTRTGVGVYVVAYTAALTNSANCYEISLGQAGFAFISAEAVGSVTISTVDTTNTPADPAMVSLVVHGAN